MLSKSMSRSRRCDHCGGDLFLLGSLGTRECYRCRHCGLMYSFKAAVKLPNTERPPQPSNGGEGG